MKIEDLGFVDDLSQASAHALQGQGAAVSTGSFVLSVGEYTQSETDAKVFAFSSPYTGDIAMGYTLGYGGAYTPAVGDLADWKAWVALYYKSKP